MITKTQSSPWPRTIVLVFIALALFDGVIIVLASRTRPALMDEQPYMEGLKFENVIDEKRTAIRDGVLPKLRLCDRSVELNLAGLQTDKQWSVDLELLRPDRSELDQRLHLSGTGPSFNFQTSPIKEGLWMARLRVHNSEVSYYFEMQEFVQCNR